MDNSNQEVPNSVTQFDQHTMPVGHSGNHTAKSIDGSFVVAPKEPTRTTVQQVENVSIGGVEMPIATAFSMGLIENPNQTGGQIIERTQAIEEASNNTPGVPVEEVPVVLSNESQSAYDQAVKNNHSATHQALGELLKNGDISEATVDDLRQATGKSAKEVKDLANEAIEGISTVLEYTTQEPSAGELLMDCYNQSPNLAQSACQNALSGDLSLATDLVTKQKQELDTNPRYREGLKEALEGSGYSVDETDGGNFVVSGNDLQYHTQWKHMAKNFHLNFEDS